MTGEDRVIIILITTMIGLTIEGTSITQRGSIIIRIPDKIIVVIMPTITTVEIQITLGQIVTREIIIIDQITIITGRIITTPIIIIIIDKTMEITVVITSEGYTTLMPVEVAKVDRTTRVAGVTTVITARATAREKITNLDITLTEVTVAKIIDEYQEMRKFIITGMDQDPKNRVHPTQAGTQITVSYTHLDVYKRQVYLSG